MERLLFISTWIGSWFAFLIGEWHVSLTILFVFLLLGGITAFFKAILTRNINSTNAYKVVIKKIGIVLAVMLANMLDMLTGYDLLFRSMTILGFIGLIGLEIIENFGHMGVPLPEPVTKYLAQLSGEKQDENKEK